MRYNFKTNIVILICIALIATMTPAYVFAGSLDSGIELNGSGTEATATGSDSGAGANATDSDLLAGADASDRDSDASSEADSESGSEDSENRQYSEYANIERDKVLHYPDGTTHKNESYENTAPPDNTPENTSETGDSATGESSNEDAEKNKSNGAGVPNDGAGAPNDGAGVFNEGGSALNDGEDTDDGLNDSMSDDRGTDSSSNATVSSDDTLSHEENKSIMGNSVSSATLQIINESDDYEIDPVPEAEAMEGYGGNIDTFFDFPNTYRLQDTSTTLPEDYSSVYEDIVNTPGNQGNTEHCWAHVAASMAETSIMKRYGLTTDDNIHFNPTQIARNTYYYYRSDWANYTSKGNVYSTNSDGTTNIDKTYFTKRILQESISSNSQNNTFVLKELAVTSPDDEFMDNAMGSLVWTTFSLARWAGPTKEITESSAMYAGAESVYASAHLENAYWVPNNDLKAIKTLIYKYGSVGIQIAMSTTAPLRPSEGYRYSPAIPSDTNHAVTIVGWDDNLPREKFAAYKSNGELLRIPDRDGGFLIKNSYGTERKDEPGGYFWISYEDGAFQPYNRATRIAVAFEFTYPEDEEHYYDHVYSHDGGNGNDIYETKRTYVTYKAKTNATDSVELLKAVGVAVADAGKYKIEIFYHKEGSGIAINQYPIETMTAELPYTGYHTIELRDPILLYDGDDFTISVEKYDGKLFNIFVDDAYNQAYSMKKSGKTLSGNICFRTYMSYADCYFVTKDDKVISGNSLYRTRFASGGKILTDLYGKSARVKAYTKTIDKPKIADQTNLDLALEKYVWSYTGNNINPMAVLKLKDTGYVVMSNHYAVSYANHKDAGIAAVIVRGDGTVFSGEISCAFKIVSTPVSLRNCKFYGIDERAYRSDGKYTQENLVVRYWIPETSHYLTLQEGVDYRVGSVEGINQAGKTNTIMITGIGAFRNTVKKKFKITKTNKPKPICDSTIEAKLSYKGEEWTDFIHEVDYTGQKYYPDIVLTDTETGETLRKGIHYKSVVYKDNKNPGLAQIVVKARGGKGAAYSGKLTRFFLIKPLKITTDATLKISPNKYKYTGKEIKPKPIVKYFGERIGNNNLYTIYYNNTGSSTSTITSQVIVFGRRKYDGYVGYTTFTIEPSD